MERPVLLDVPVVADSWRQARRKVLDSLPEQLAQFEPLRGRKVIRTHTELNRLSTPDFRIWNVTLEFED